MSDRLHKQRSVGSKHGGIASAVSARIVINRKSRNLLLLLAWLQGEND
jgi:hypothetical protein